MSRDSAQRGESFDRRHLARARSALVWGLFLFAAAQFAYLLLLERWRPDLRDPEYGCKLALLRPQLSADRPLVVALGSSRMDLGFRPDVLSECRLADGRAPLFFNYGLTGSGPVQELVLLQRLLAAGIRPRWVVIEVLPPFLHSEGSMEDQLHLDALGWGDLQRVRRYCSHPGEVYGRWCQTEVMPWFAHRFCLMSCYAPNWLPFQNRLDYIWYGLDAAGWFACRKESTDESQHRLRVEKVRTEYVGFFRQFRISPAPDLALQEMLALCRREEIGAILVWMPEASEFRGWYPPEARAMVDIYLSELGRKYEVPVVNASKWVNDRDFFDGHHLLVDGARVFSARLGRDVLGPLLAGRPLSVGSP